MSTENDIVTLLKTNGTLTAIPFHLATDPQSVALPKITIEKIGERRQYSNDGDAGLSTANYQLNAIAASMNAAKTLARAMKSTLAANMLATYGSTRFAGIFIEAEKDMAAPTEAGIEKPAQISILSIRANFYDSL